VVYIGGDKNLDCLKRIVDSGVPLVMIDHFLEGVPSHYVVTDGYVGAYNATRRLLNTGNEKIYCFTMQECNTQTSDRFAGYSEAIKRHGAAVDNDLIISAKGEDAITLEENGYRLTKKILKNFSGPFSAFAINSPLVSGVWRALEESGLSHDRISLACFDNPMVPIPEDVLLIQVTQPTAEIARRSVQIIAEHIAGNPDPQRIVLPPTVEVASGVNAARLLLPYGEAVSTPVEG